MFAQRLRLTNKLSRERGFVNKGVDTPDAVANRLRLMNALNTALSMIPQYP